MRADRLPLVLIPQHFGCLVFDRRTSRYLPFDAPATELLLALTRGPLEPLLAGLADPEEREAVLGFHEAFYDLGFFRLDGTLAAAVLDVAVPPDHLVGPLAVHLEVVAACNLTCTHCFAGSLPRNDAPLTVGEMDRLFADLASLGSFRLGLTGGEPLLRKDLLEILDAATDRGLHPCLTTNGLLLTESLARELGRRELVWLNVSLEGPTAEVNDAVRGRGSFAAAVEKIRLLRDRARFTLAFTLMSHNAHLARQCAELAAELGAHTAVFRPLYPTGTALHHLELMPRFDQYVGALDELAAMESPRADLRALDAFGPAQRAGQQPEIHRSHDCGAGVHVCSISVQGDLNPCSFLGPSFAAGNIRRTPFPELWRTSEKLRAMRDERAHPGGCRARAQALGGSANAEDPWFAEFRARRERHPSDNLEMTVVKKP